MGSYLSRKSTSTGGSHRVVVYSTPTCVWCRKAKTYLESRGVPYRDVDVSSDRSAALGLIRRTGQTSVPVIEIDGRTIVGFDQLRIDEALNSMAN